MGQTKDRAEIVLARDEFTATRRGLEGHPEAVASSSRIDVEDFYGNVTTWVLDLYRLEGKVTAFVQMGRASDYTRLVVPPEVTAAIARHQAGLATKHRRKVARRIVANKRAQGITLGNLAGLEAARQARGKRGKK